MNLKEPNIQNLMEEYGALGLGAYILIKDAVLTSQKMTDVFKMLEGKVSQQMIENILKFSGLFFSVDKVNYMHYTERKTNLTTDDAYPLFEKSFPRRRFFDEMKQAHGLPESEVLAQFNKWKEHNLGFLFTDERHLRNSFNLWLSKVEKKTHKEEIDWSSL